MAVAATGFFDGVHLGHGAVIDTLLSSARARGEQSLAVTFWPHPRVVLQSDARNFKLLTSKEEKLTLLKNLGVDKVEVLPFGKAFAALKAEEYLAMLRERFDVDAIVLGHDNRFGSDGLSTSQIDSLAKSLGFGVEVVPPVPYYSAPISSTRIRKSLEDGDVESAAVMLGRPYSFEGVVVPGNQMGRTINFPTANTRLKEPLKAVPKPAAYFSRIYVAGEPFFSMTNIDSNYKIETNIFDFDRDIYGYEVRVEFLRRLRDEIRFASFEQLRRQLLQDRSNAQALGQSISLGFARVGKKF